jgi:uncharacterized protein
MTMERRFVSSEKNMVRVDMMPDGKKKIVGYAAVFYDPTDDGTEFVLWDDSWGRAVERIMPGAFDMALSRPDDCRGLFNHDPSMMLGRTKAGTMSLAKDATGLTYAIEPGDTGCGQDVMAHIARGDVTGSSFGFNIPPQGQKWTSMTDENGKVQEIRELLSVELLDCGPVTFPAYEAATAGIRSKSGVEEARAARDAWISTQPKPPIVFPATPRMDLGRIELAKKTLDMETSLLL